LYLCCLIAVPLSPASLGSSATRKAVGTRALCSDIGSFRERTSRSRLQREDELNLHGRGPRPKQIRGLGVVPRTGFVRNSEGELFTTFGTFHQTNDGSHTEKFAYFASVKGNRAATMGWKARVKISCMIACGVSEAWRHSFTIVMQITNSGSSQALRRDATGRRTHKKCSGPLTRRSRRWQRSLSPQSQRAVILSCGGKPFVGVFRF
jgi:hypothetical protein